jgi:ribonuclease HII
VSDGGGTCREEESMNGSEVDREMHERLAREEGYSKIAGVDEVARASWAGPMVAAAVILPDGFDAKGIRDAKKMKQAARAKAYDRITSEAVSFAVLEVSAQDIDSKGIEACHMELLRDVVAALDVEPDYVLVDHYVVPGLPQRQKGIDKGDDLSVSIAAASILAKVTCDRIMDELHLRYPEYGFDRNRGYGTPLHREALGRWGLTSAHRLNRGTKKWASVAPRPEP